MEKWTPFILFAFASILSLQVWLTKRSFAQETSHKLLQQAVAFYIENAGKGAAILLNTPNPAPEHIRPLLSKFTHGQLKDPDERQQLLEWAKTAASDRESPRDERGIAYGLVGALGALKKMSECKTQKKK